MKRKTLNGNPRLAPVSGSNNGKFGFSLNGTRRGNYMGRETNLAPGAQTGPQQMIGSSPSKPTGPGIYGHPAAVCTNDETVVKTTVINTRGMLSRRLRGIKKQVPVAPIRVALSQSLNCSEPSACGCGTGQIIVPAYDVETQYFPECEKNNTQQCTGPLSVNWVKANSNGNGAVEFSAGEYIRLKRQIGTCFGGEFIGVENYRRTQGYTWRNDGKSFLGIIGITAGEGMYWLQSVPQGRYPSTFGIPQKTIDLLSSPATDQNLIGDSLMPETSTCSLLKSQQPPGTLINTTGNQSKARQPLPGLQWRTSTQPLNPITSPSCNIVKPGILTVSYGTNGVPNSANSVLAKRVRCSGHGLRRPIPAPNFGQKGCRGAVSTLEPILGGWEDWRGGGIFLIGWSPSETLSKALQQSLRGNMWPWNLNIAPGFQVGVGYPDGVDWEDQEGQGIFTLSEKKTLGGKTIPPFITRNPYKYQNAQR